MNKKTLQKMAGILMFTAVCSFGCSESTSSKTETDSGIRETAVIREKPPLTQQEASSAIQDTSKSSLDTLQMATP